MPEPMQQLFAAIDSPPRPEFVDRLRAELLDALELGDAPDSADAGLTDTVSDRDHDHHHDQEDEAPPMAELTSPLPAPSRRWRTIALALTATAAAVVIALLLVSRGSEEGSVDRTPPATTPPVELEQPEATDPDGAGPISVSLDVDALNLFTSEDLVIAGTLSELVRVDPADNRVLARRPFNTLGAILAEGKAWAVDRTGTLHRLDPDTLETEATLAIPGATERRDGGPGSPLAYEGGRLWAVTGDAVVAVDPATMTEVLRTPLEGADDLAAGFGAVWVKAGVIGTNLVRISPADGAVTATRPVGGNIRRIAVGAGSVWVADADSGDVVRVDPGSATITAKIDVGEHGAGEMAVRDTHLWVAVFPEDAIVRIDPATNTVVERVTGIVGPAALGYSGTSLWIANAQSSLTRYEAGR